jgi:transposase
MYLGIDIHKRYSQVAVVEPDGNLQDEIRLPNDRLDELAEQYAGSEAAIEASGNYRPMTVAAVIGSCVILYPDLTHTSRFGS